MLSTGSGFQSLLKEGYRHYVGLQEAILRNIEACKELSQMTRTSYGPNGMKKMVVNHIDKMFVTNDSSTILREIEVAHPASKLIVMAAKMQKEDFGDGTNYVVTLAGELLCQAESLIKSGLHPSVIITGYKIAMKEALDSLEPLVTLKINSESKEEDMLPVIESSLAPKIPNYYKFFAQIMTKACKGIIQPAEPRFNVDHVRIVKVIGGSLEASQLISGYVITRGPEGDYSSPLEKVKVACFGCPFDP
jgi:T-complex protein 1 subunit theta